MALFERGAKGAVDDAELVAFLEDDASCQAVDAYARSSGLASIHIEKGRIDDVIRYLLQAAKPPKQLLIDISTSDMPLSDLGRLAEVCEPSIHVYAVGSRNDVGLYRDLLAMGVLDYLVKPITSELVRRLVGGEVSGGGVSTQRLRSGKIISLVGTRGGVGVSTIGTHLARTLLEGNARRRIAYVELNPFGGAAAIQLGLPRLNILGEILGNAARIDPQYLERTLLEGNARRRIAYVELNPFGGAAAIQLGLPRLNILGEILGNAARIDPQYLERTLATKDNRLFLLSSQATPGDELNWPGGALTDVIGMLAHHFHYVLVDVPHTLGPLADEALALSQVSAVVADLSVHSTQALDRLLPYCLGREPAPTLYLLLNQPQPETRGQVERRDFAQLVEHPVTQTFPHDSRHLTLAENLGETLPAGAPFQHSINRLSSMLSGGTIETQDAGQQGWRRWLPWRRAEVS